MQSILPPTTNIPEAYAHGSNEEQVSLRKLAWFTTKLLVKHLSDKFPLCLGIYTKCGTVLHIIFQGKFIFSILCYLWLQGRFILMKCNVTWWKNVRYHELLCRSFLCLSFCFCMSTLPPIFSFYVYFTYWFFVCLMSVQVFINKNSCVVIPFYSCRFIFEFWSPLKKIYLLCLWVLNISSISHMWMILRFLRYDYNIYVFTMNAYVVIAQIVFRSQS